MNLIEIHAAKQTQCFGLIRLQTTPATLIDHCNHGLRRAELSLLNQLSCARLIQLRLHLTWFEYTHTLTALGRTHGLMIRELARGILQPDVMIFQLL
jgi:hypothetical protein